MPAVILAAGLGLVAFTGCSSAGTTDGSAGGPSDQTVAEACSDATDSVSAVQSDMTDITSQVSAGNFSVVAEQLGALHTNLRETADSLRNPEVRDTLGTLADEVGAFAAIFEDAPDGDLTALGDKVDELQAVSQDVATAGQAMSDLCG